MNLSAGQLTALATDINAQGSLASARTTHDAPAVANFYNAASATAVWRSDLRNSEVVAALVGSDVSALASSGLLGLLQLLVMPLTIDASSANIRSDFTTLFSGKTSLTNLTAVAQRTATRIEALFGSGGPPITCGTDVGGLSLFGQPLDAGTVAKAMGW